MIKETKLHYPEKTMFQMIENIAGQYPDEPAYEFYDIRTSFRDFVEKAEDAAKAFRANGIHKGDRVTICMPNCPQALNAFYGLNRIGAVAVMIHPQSAQSEISFYLNDSQSKMILVLDMFCQKVEDALKDVDHPVKVLVARMQNELPLHLKALYIAKEGRKYLGLPNTDHAVLWSKFLRTGWTEELLPSEYEEDRTAVILYSGGTTGVPKGIELTDLNFNSCAIQARDAIDEEFRVGLSCLGCMPIFHGFGLGINIHAIMMHGVCCILMPTFNSKSYADMLKRKKPNIIAGVPTIFEALLHLPELEGFDMSFLIGMFSGGDSLSVELKNKIDRFLEEHNAGIQVREGYGLTECVTASCLTPKNTHKDGSIGLPFKDTVYAIVKPDTDEVLPNGEEGEIIMRGPSVMKGYLNNEFENQKALRRLPDGNIWLYTGDLGKMDDDGYVYFSQRIKRMIITNGYNVYPSQVENAIDGCEEVSYSCVIGVKDPRRMQRIRAYVVLKDGYEPTEETRMSIMEQLAVHVASYALPKELLFKDSMPKTLVGKVAYRVLEKEAEEELITAEGKENYNQ
jgi:long-chain acyl-CoA synthetase